LFVLSGVEETEIFELMHPVVDGFLSDVQPGEPGQPVVGLRLVRERAVVLAFDEGVRPEAVNLASVCLLDSVEEVNRAVWDRQQRL
jgi:hypothetical protein